MAANPDTVEWLEQHLHDVHLPPEVPWWPPAPGWWVLASISIALAIWVLWRYRQRVQGRNPRRRALAQLDRLHAHWQRSQPPTQVRDSSNEHSVCDDHSGSEPMQDYLRQCNLILRELAIALAGRTEVSQLTGPAWSAWLEQGLSQPLPAEVRVLLDSACYQRTVTADIENLYLNVQRVIQDCTASQPQRAAYA